MDPSVDLIHLRAEQRAYLHQFAYDPRTLSATPFFPVGVSSITNLIHPFYVPSIGVLKNPYLGIQPYNRYLAMAKETTFEPVYSNLWNTYIIPFLILLTTTK